MHIQVFRDWTGLPWLTNIPVLEGNQETMKETLFFWRMLANKLIICFKLLKYQCKCEQMLSAQFLGWTLCWLVLFLSWSLNSPCLCHCRCSCWPSGWGRLPSVREHWANSNRADQFERWGCSSDYSGSRLLAPFAAQVLRVFFDGSIERRKASVVFNLVPLHHQLTCCCLVSIGVLVGS